MSITIAKLYDETLEYVKRLDSTTYEESILLVDLRDMVLNELKKDIVLTEDERKMLRQIGEFDKAILARFTELKDEASNAMQKINVTRMQKQKYEQAYAPQSYFVDYKE
ncbi:hypothetical protein D3P08_25110 [Paenibacillus nanensis]|uniref:Flagellar protein FliT n=1 Tax=Paenibacillus nanensis TaxID=393251 RepID=A0A3A1UNG8_9BACL|nr:hypothetical protein [Paenibacillus nanensis]RIX47305.1 hypothetical protein D3P08_25110 [Paenibacillus nanensis]